MKLKICNCSTNSYFHCYHGELYYSEYIFGGYNKTESINTLSNNVIYILKK